MARLKCTACGRPQAVCLCPWIVPIENPVNLVVLRHKSEASHALNTVEILKLSLSNVEVVDGEIFEPVKNAVLVYPGEGSTSLEGIDSSVDVTFILLDGTWRKTKKILHLNPWLETLPKISLPSLNSSYVLRKKSPEGFSTLEAAVGLLSHIDQNEAKYTPLLEAMKQMMQFQIDRMGTEVFEKNFSDRV